MSDGVYKNHPVYIHDLSIMATEDILYNILRINIDSFKYLELMQSADIIRK